MLFTYLFKSTSTSTCPYHCAYTHVRPQRIVNLLRNRRLMYSINVRPAAADDANRLQLIIKCIDVCMYERESAMKTMQ